MNGVLYIATGPGFTKAANASARSVRQYVPGIGIDVFSDHPSLLETDLFDRVATIPDPHRRSKVDYLPRSRFGRTLYLDTDTRVVADIRAVFDILDRFDIAFAHAHSRNKASHTEPWRKKLPDAFPQLNGGVILYKASYSVLQFLESWKKAYHLACFQKDQTTLRELVWDSDLRLSILPPEYNIRYEKYVNVWNREEATPKILHYKRFHDELGAAEIGQKTRRLRPLVRKLQRFLHRRVDTRENQKSSMKIFGIGFHKTGTSSLASALKILGYRTIHGDSRKSWRGGDEGRTLIRRIEAGDYDLPTFPLFDAFTDNPYFSIWRELDARFDAKFIFTVRNEDCWIESCVRYYKGRRIRPMRAWMFGDHADPSFSRLARQTWLDAYRRHNEEVLSHFAERRNFLIMDIAVSDGWDKLCGFLGQSVPRAAFPHANRTKEKGLRRWML